MRQMENSLNLLETGQQPKEAKRCSKKLWSFSIAFILLLISAAVGLCYFFHSKTPENCWTQATLSFKTQKHGTMDWKWTKEFSSCMEETEHQTLRIKQNGLYILYIHLTRKNSYNKEESSRFAVQLKKGDVVLNQSESNGTVISLLGIHHLNQGDELSLKLNDANMKSIEENTAETYWGILRVTH